MLEVVPCLNQKMPGAQVMPRVLLEGSSLSKQNSSTLLELIAKNNRKIFSIRLDSVVVSS